MADFSLSTPSPYPLQNLPRAICPRSLRFSHSTVLRRPAAGLNGQLDPVQPGLACGSDTAHLSIFGYDPRRWERADAASLKGLTRVE